MPAVALRSFSVGIWYTVFRIGIFLWYFAFGICFRFFAFGILYRHFWHYHLSVMTMSELNSVD